ncbi:MAG: VOC family protein [Acidimicrobiia bacterium]
MPIQRLNHAVLYVRDAAASADFYSAALGFTVRHEMPGAVFLGAPGSVNDHDLGLFSIGPGAGASGAGRSTVGLYHLAWEVERLGDLVEIMKSLEEHHALVGASDHGTSKSLYARDADGIEFEVHWNVPPELMTESDRSIRTEPLDVDATLSRFGADAPSHSTTLRAPQH